MDRLGIDIGSKTIKLVLLDGESGKVLFSSYQFHRSKVQQYLLSAVKSCLARCKDRQVQVTVTGSAGMRVAELFDIPFVQEVVALRCAVEAELPDTDVVLEMGGEDTKLVYLTGVPEQRMNTVCAGGTGGFIEMMASMMGTTASHMQGLAAGATTIYPIASRCAVFAKSDVRPLLNAGAKKEDIAASVLRAVCTQAVAGLSAGRPIEGRVVLLGGPFEYIPEMKRAFCTVTDISREEVTVPKDAHLFVARGAALSPDASAPMDLARFVEEVGQAQFANEEGIRSLPPLFTSQEEYDAFRQRHSSCAVPRANIFHCAGDLFLGIDAGSTTMKVALVNEAGELCAFQYDWNEGDVTLSLPEMLQEIYKDVGFSYMDEKVIRRSCVVGYGEDFCRSAYKIDMGEVETVAHLRAAREIEPEVDFLLDIGGQDIKCFYIRDGLIEDIVLNEACSSGCGSLFDSVARSMSMGKEALAGQALFAGRPVDLGTRCSTFMDSRVKHAQKEGATFGDIAAGVCWSTARNALFKVVRQPDFSKVGKHVVVQGGAFANDALLRAFELECGVEVTRPDLPELMGAWGAALLARDEWLALKEKDPDMAHRVRSSLLDSVDLGKFDKKRTTTRCELCPNNCRLMITTFFSKDDDAGETRTFVTGNRCERGAAAYRDAREKTPAPPNMVKAKNALIDSFDHMPQPDSAVKVGIPKALSLYESYPFWRTFFNELGYAVIAGEKSGEEVFCKGMSCIPAEGACYPSKLAYGHCMALHEKGADVIFIPYLGLDFARRGLLGTGFGAFARECPLVEYLPDMVRGNSAGTALEEQRFLAPDFRAVGSSGECVVALQEALEDVGLCSDPALVRRAWERAQEAYRGFFEKLQKANANVIARIDAGEFPGALVAGHPYHADPGIGHGIDEVVSELGYAVLERMSYDFEDGRPAGEGLWISNADLDAQVTMALSHPDLQVIIPRSFGCGIDALCADALHARLRASERVFAEIKLDQIVDLAAVRIRLRSLAYAQRQRSEKKSISDIVDLTWQFMTEEELARVEKSEAERKLRLAQEQARILIGARYGSGRTVHDVLREHIAEQAARKSRQVSRMPELHAFAPEDLPSLTADQEREHPHAADIAAMRATGYELVADLVSDPVRNALPVTCSIVFARGFELAEFATWDEVASFAAQPGRGRCSTLEDLSALAAAHEETVAALAARGLSLAPSNAASCCLALVDQVGADEVYFASSDGIWSFFEWADAEAYATADGKPASPVPERPSSSPSSPLVAVERTVSFKQHANQIDRMKLRGFKLIDEYEQPPVPQPDVYSIFFTDDRRILCFASWEQVDALLSGRIAQDEVHGFTVAPFVGLPGMGRLDVIGKEVQFDEDSPDGFSTINTAASVDEAKTMAEHPEAVAAMRRLGYTLITEYGKDAFQALAVGYVYRVFFASDTDMRGFKTWDEVDDFIAGKDVGTMFGEVQAMPRVAGKAGVAFSDRERV